jgi:hypothetical protein
LYEAIVRRGERARCGEGKAAGNGRGYKTHFFSSATKFEIYKNKERSPNAAHSGHHTLSLSTKEERGRGRGRMGERENGGEGERREKIEQGRGSDRAYITKRRCNITLSPFFSSLSLFPSLIFEAIRDRVRDLRQ